MSRSQTCGFWGQLLSRLLPMRSMGDWRLIPCTESWSSTCLAPGMWGLKFFICDSKPSLCIIWLHWDKGLTCRLGSPSSCLDCQSLLPVSLWADSIPSWRRYVIAVYVQQKLGPWFPVNFCIYVIYPSFPLPLSGRSHIWPHWWETWAPLQPVPICKHFSSAAGKISLVILPFWSWTYYCSCLILLHVVTPLQGGPLSLACEQKCMSAAPEVQPWWGKAKWPARSLAHKDGCKGLLI